MAKQFKVNDKKLEVYFCDSGQIEIYDLKDIKHTGFIFKDIKELNLFINNLTDIAEEYIMENE